jgi:hypothetical protein
MSFIRSSQRQPCPLCPDKDQHGDCRFSKADNLILCHRWIDQPSPYAEATQYKYLHRSKNDLWGVYVYQQAGVDGKTRGKKPPRSGGRQSLYYSDRHGHNLIRVVRTPKANGGKDFKQYRWDGVEYKPGLKEFDKRNVPIYRYQEVRSAITQGKTIFMVG